MDKLYYRLLKLFLVMMLTISFYVIIMYSIKFLYPFIIAILVAIFLHPIVTYFEIKWGWKRNIATLAVMVLCLFVFGLFAFIIFKILLDESSVLIKRLPNFFHEMTVIFFEIGEKFVAPFYEKITIFFPSLGKWKNIDFHYYSELITNHLTSISTDFFKKLLSILTAFLTSITYFGTILIFILLVIYILTKDMILFQLQCKKMIPYHVINKMKIILQKLKKTTFSFVKAQITIALISSTIIFIFLLIFHYPHVLTITIIIFFVDFIPYIGIGIIFIPWILFLFVTSNYLSTIQLSLLYIFVIVIRQLIEPNIIASSINIHSIFFINILLISFQFLLLFGIVLTPIILISISTIYHARILHYIWKFITE